MTDNAQNTDTEDDNWGVLGELPGDFMMWVLIASELLVFGAALLAFVAVRATDVTGFAADQQQLNQTAGAANTIVLVTSGFFAALAVSASAKFQKKRARVMLAAAMTLGLVFIGVKGIEYWQKAEAGIGLDSSPFFTFYYLITGFHAAHVIAGIVIFALVSFFDDKRNIETAAAFWHMVDLVWVILFPIIYLVR